MRQYMVVVHPPKPEHKPRATVQSYGVVPKGPSVRFVDALTPEDAARASGVEPGGHCVVVLDARRFDRSKEAPLLEKRLDGFPLDEAS